MNEKIMSEEAFNELIANIEVVSKLTLYGRKNIKYYFKKLKQENQNLKDKLEQSIAVADTNSELAESYYNENQKLKEQKRLILKNIKEWIRCSKSEQLEDDLVHEKYWNSFEQILRNIFNNYNTEHLNDEDLKYKQYLEKENEELIKQLQQKEDIINKAKEFTKGHIFQFDGDKDFDALLEILKENK